MKRILFLLIISFYFISTRAYDLKREPVVYWFDHLSTLLITIKNLPKGVYILNGKKVMVK